MTPAIIALVLAAMMQAPAGRAARLQALHLGEAETYAIYRDPARTQRLDLVREPVCRWSNPTRDGGQEGDVFLWTYRGRPEVVASVFSHPRAGRTERRINHELHSLSEAVLVVDRDSPNRWEPKAAGVEVMPVPGAPAPGASPAQRLVQLRALAREFSGRSLSEKDRTWELRVLPRPLYRYESTDPTVIDDAFFALVSDAGTDPEIILLIEAHKTPEGAKWVYGDARFSDMNLWLRHKDREVWSMIRGPENTFNSGAGGRFRFYQDRIVPEVAAPPETEPKKAEAK